MNERTIGKVNHAACPIFTYVGLDYNYIFRVSITFACAKSMHNCYQVIYKLNVTAIDALDKTDKSLWTDGSCFDGHGIVLDANHMQLLVCCASKLF